MIVGSHVKVLVLTNVILVVLDILALVAVVVNMVVLADVREDVNLVVIVGVREVFKIANSFFIYIFLRITRHDYD